MRKYVAEFIAAFFLVFAGAGSIIADVYRAQVGLTDTLGLVGVALAHGLALSIAIAAVGHISGGHANPVVTIAAFVNGRISARDMFGYVPAQLAGGTAAAFLLKAVTPGPSFRFSGGGVPALGAGVGPLPGLVLEMVLTFFLVFAIWALAVDERTSKGLAPFGIGLVLTFDILAGGPFTGAAMNPARWLGPAIASGQFANLSVWLAGPLLGALVASKLYELVFIREPKAAEGGVLETVPAPAAAAVPASRGDDIPEAPPPLPPEAVPPPPPPPPQAPSPEQPGS